MRDIYSFTSKEILLNLDSRQMMKTWSIKGLLFSVREVPKEAHHRNLCHVGGDMSQFVEMQKKIRQKKRG